MLHLRRRLQLWYLSPSQLILLHVTSESFVSQGSWRFVVFLPVVVVCVSGVADGGVYGWLCSLSSSCCSLFGTSVVWGLWALGLDTVLTANPFAEFYTLIVLCECPLFTLFCNLVSRPYAGSLGCASD
ncbi:hypothetical protein MtrunA17_Chr1g0179351 [Medicago truncatula]|uniref:Transmembrane protein n=1 Tax=Medicago truncatula TaxID=3880 RepID=A0A396JQZ7_MEDTR|nr:hypothetical protein MtrunA17_Chr1g0179351 [Medicago truncatula]